MTKAPIYYTVGQVRFSPILKMADFIENLQATLRQNFPDFSHDRRTQFEVHLGDGANQGPELKALSSPRWHFKNEQQTSGYILMLDSIIFHTTAYENSEVFLERLLEGLRYVHKEVCLSFIEGVGIRTLDLIRPAEDGGFEQYLDCRLLGISSSIRGAVKQSISELVVDSPYGQLTSRVAQLTGKVGIPVDLAPLSLLLPEELRLFEGKHAILESDCAQLRRFSYDEEEVYRRLQEVKQGVTEPFYVATTEYARKMWA